MDGKRCAKGKSDHNPGRIKMEKGGKNQQQKTFYSKTRYAANPKSSPSPKMNMPENPRVVSKAKSIPLGRAQEIV